MKQYKVCLHKKDAHTLEKKEDGKWYLDHQEIPQEKAIEELVEAVKDLGYWCQVAKDVLPEDQFEMVNESYSYHEEYGEKKPLKSYLVKVKGKELYYGGFMLFYESKERAATYELEKAKSVANALDTSMNELEVVEY